MSKASEKARAERRAADHHATHVKAFVEAGGAELYGDTPAQHIADHVAMSEPQSVHAVALVPEDGGYRLVSLALTPSMAEACATSATEPELLQQQLYKAMAMLEDLARGMAPDGSKRARQCPACGVAALVRHPNKPVDLCTACDTRHEVSA